MILYSKETAAVIVRDSTRSISFKKIFINILNTCCVHVCVFYVRVSHIFVSENNSVKRNVHITKWYIYNNNIPNYSLFVFFFLDRRIQRFLVVVVTSDQGRPQKCSPDRARYILYIFMVFYTVIILFIQCITYCKLRKKIDGII